MSRFDDHEPDTEAGKRLLADEFPGGGDDLDVVEMIAFRDAILAIEAEARQAVLRELREGLDWLVIFDRAAGGDGNGTHGQDRGGFNARVDRQLAALDASEGRT